MVAGALVPLPYPEVAVIERETLDAQTPAIAEALAGQTDRGRGLLLHARRSSVRRRRRVDRLAVVWIDAHGDLNTPETSPSGNLWGMPFRMLLDAGVVSAADAALVGARSLDPPELEYLEQTGIDDSLDRALDGADAIYVALDLDVLDPSDVDVLVPEPNGPSPDSIERLLGDLAGRTTIAGIGVTGFLDTERNAALASRGCFARPVSRPPLDCPAWLPGRVESTSRSRASAPRSPPRGSIRTPARAADRTTATRSSQRRFASARSAVTTSASVRASGSSSSSIRARSSRATPTFARPTRSSSSTSVRTRERLVEAEMETGLGDAIVCGRGEIEGQACDLAVMDFAFMGGSMGSVVGEKFVRACERAADAGVPLVSVSASGGARMQEGILALMQLPKTICAIDELHESGRRDALRPDAPDDGRRARELREPRRRRARGAGRAHVLRRPARRLADHAREAPRRLRPRRVELPLRPSRRDRPSTRAARGRWRGFSACSTRS